MGDPNPSTTNNQGRRIQPIRNGCAGLSWDCSFFRLHLSAATVTRARRPIKLVVKRLLPVDTPFLWLAPMKTRLRIELA